MDRSEVLTLIGTGYKMDEIAQERAVERPRQVFCNVSGVSRAEWTDAGRAGFRPEYRVTLFAPDYEGERIAVLRGVRYGVYRTYLAQDETIELYLERKAGV